MKDLSATVVVYKNSADMLVKAIHSFLSSTKDSKNIGFGTENSDLSRRIYKHHRTAHFPMAIIYRYHQRGPYRNAWSGNINNAVNYFDKCWWANEWEREYFNQQTMQQFAEMGG
jgi:hypothetical protein